MPKFFRVSEFIHVAFDHVVSIEFTWLPVVSGPDLDITDDYNLDATVLTTSGKEYVTEGHEFAYELVALFDLPLPDKPEV